MHKIWLIKRSSSKFSHIYIDLLSPPFSSFFQRVLQSRRPFIQKVWTKISTKLTQKSDSKSSNDNEIELRNLSLPRFIEFVMVNFLYCLFFVLPYFSLSFSIQDHPPFFPLSPYFFLLILSSIIHFYILWFYFFFIIKELEYTIHDKKKRSKDIWIFSTRRFRVIWCHTCYIPSNSLH